MPLSSVWPSATIVSVFSLCCTPPSVLVPIDFSRVTAPSPASITSVSPLSVLSLINPVIRTSESLAVVSIVTFAVNSTPSSSKTFPAEVISPPRVVVLPGPCTVRPPAPTSTVSPNIVSEALTVNAPRTIVFPTISLNVTVPF